MFIIYREREITKIFNDMVESFKPDKRYEVGTLKDFILLVPETVALDYTIDDGRCSVKKFVNNEGVIKIEGGSVTMSSTETTDSRLKFNNSVQITIQEGQYDRFTDIIRQVELNKYRVVVEDLMGNQFVMNVEFPAFVTHSVTFTTMTSPNTFTIGLSTESNFPTLFLESKVSAVSTFNMRLCKYVTGRIVDFRMAQKELVNMIERDGKIQSILSYQEGAFKKIDSITNSFTYTESYDGEKYQQQLQFTIPLTEYKHYWQYNLVQFTDNRYAILIMTENGTLIGSGFEFGYIPSYVIETSEEVSVQNTIQITLVSVGSKPTADRTVDIDPSTGLPDLDGFIEDDDTVIYLPVDSFQKGNLFYETDICINQTQSMYVLLEECTVVGGRLGRFWCHVQYEEMFREAGLNIVGTYDTTGVWNGVAILHSNSKCSGDSGYCKFTTTPEKVYLFTPTMREYEAYVYSDCDWHFENIPDWVTFNIESGVGGRMYIVKMTLKERPIELKSDLVNLVNEGRTFIFTLRYYEDGLSDEGNCDWLVKTNSVNANGGKLIFMLSPTVDPSKQMSSIVIEDSDGLVTNVENNSLVVTVPPNTGSDKKFYILSLKYSVSTLLPCTFLIEQTGRYYRRVPADGFLCENGDKYQKIAVYYGVESPDNTPTFSHYETGALIESNSSDCQNFTTRWVEGEGYICEGTAKWSFEKEQISYDGENWIDTDVTRKKSVIDNDSSDCDGNYDYEWRETDEYICINTTSYVILKEYVSYDGKISWHQTGEMKSGDPIRTDDPRCGGGADGDYRFVDADGYICDGTGKYSVQKEQYSSDGGETWVDTGATRKGEFLGDDPVSCDGNYDYKWEASDFAFLCDGTTSYHVEYYLVSYDDGVSWHQTGESRRDGLIAEVDSRCLSDSSVQYRWVVDTGKFICEAESTYTGQFCGYSAQQPHIIDTNGIDHKIPYISLIDSNFDYDVPEEWFDNKNVSPRFYNAQDIRCLPVLENFINLNSLFSPPTSTLLQVRSISQDALENIKMTGVRNTTSMFYRVLTTSLDLRNWRVDSLHTLNRMFSNCSNLISLNVDGWKVTGDESGKLSLNGMFLQSDKIETVDMRTWIVDDSVTKVDFFNMFAMCYGLREVYLPNFTAKHLGGYKNSDLSQMFAALEGKNLTIHCSLAFYQAYALYPSGTNVFGLDGSIKDITWITY